MQGRRRKGGVPVATGVNAGALARLLLFASSFTPVTAAAQLVVAIDDVYELAEDSAPSDLDVLANDFVFGGDGETEITAVGTPAGGEVSIVGAGARLRYR